MNPLQPCMRLCCGLALIAAMGGAHAQPTSATLQLRTLAATCAACHGTDGRAVPDSGIVGLRGRDRNELAMRLLAFRDGTRPATVMHQIAKGYTPEQIDQLAAYFAGLPR
ncbi:MAG: cytochrome C [Rhizobacter sp.]|nr:cytochrome C [Rhizobacter sp.]